MASNYKLPYEQRVYSQHGEDGIVDHLLSNIKNPTGVCVEMGWGQDRKKARNGLAVNCTQNLVQNKGYKCYAFDLNVQNSIPENVTFYNECIDPANCAEYLSRFPLDVDFFSLDIDSFDFEIMQGLLEKGFHPKVICAEINRNLGYDYEFSYPYVQGGKYNKHVFHGVSFKKYKTYLKTHGYEFFTLNSNGVNMFFYCPDELHVDQLSDVTIQQVAEVAEKALTLAELHTEIKNNSYWKNITV